MSKTVSLVLTITDNNIEVDGTDIEYLSNRQLNSITTRLRKAVKRKRAAIQHLSAVEAAELAAKEAAILEEKAKQDAVVAAEVSVDRVVKTRMAAGVTIEGYKPEINWTDEEKAYMLNLAKEAKENPNAPESLPKDLESPTTKVKSSTKSSIK